MNRMWPVVLLLASLATALRAAPNEVRVVAVQPDVQFHKGGSPADAWLPCEKNTVLKAGDEVTCDPDGQATLAFADNSTVVVRNTTQLKIASFFTEGGVVRTEILLKMGEVAAQVNKSEATKSDFRIKSPTGTASVRGTKLEKVSFTPTTGMSVQIAEGSISLGNNSGTATAISKGEEGHVNHEGGVESPSDVHKASISSNAYAPGQTKDEVSHFQENATPPVGGSSSGGSSGDVSQVSQVVTQAPAFTGGATQVINQTFTFQNGQVDPALVTSNAVVTSQFGNAAPSPDGSPFLVLHTVEAPGGTGTATFKTSITAASVVQISFDHNFITTEDPTQFFSNDDSFTATLVNNGTTTQLVRQSVFSTPLTGFNPRGLPAFMNFPGNTPPEVAFQSGFNRFTGQFSVQPGDLTLLFTVANASDNIIQSAVALNNIQVKTVTNPAATLPLPSDSPLVSSPAGFTAMAHPAGLGFRH